MNARPSNNNNNNILINTNDLTKWEKIKIEQQLELTTLLLTLLTTTTFKICNAVGWHQLICDLLQSWAKMIKLELWQWNYRNQNCKTFLLQYVADDTGKILMSYLRCFGNMIFTRCTFLGRYWCKFVGNNAASNIKILPQQLLGTSVIKQLKSFDVLRPDETAVYSPRFLSFELSFKLFGGKRRTPFRWPN